MVKLKKFLIIIGIPPLVGILGAIFTEYILQIGVLGTPNLIYFLIAGILGGILTFFLFRKMSLTISIIIGFIFIPYFVFILGQIDFYMVDQNLVEGMSVIEVRPTMDKIVFGTPDRGEIAVWKGPQTLILHPGENRVRLGRFDMTAGTYRGGTVYINDIQVDIEADFSIMKDPVSGQSIPPDYYSQVFEMIKAGMSGNVAGFNIGIINAALTENIGKFTISVGKMTQQIPVPEIKYPGMGGPDITLDITLDEMGRPDPSKIRAIVDMPPGVGTAFPQAPGIEFR